MTPASGTDGTTTTDPAVPESHRDLLDTPVATLATTGADGFPQVTAVWFLWDDGRLRLSLNSSRQKVRNLQRSAKCTLLILDLQNPYRYLEIRAKARLEADAEYQFAAKVGQKYGADLKQYDAPGSERVVVTLEPVKINAVTMG
jgi:PPOX class probable F420-dependent enzyme